jgi:hypothetical protein
MRSTHNINAIHDGSLGSTSDVDVKVEVFGDSSTGWPVHADGVDLVEERDRSVLVGEIADGLDGSDTAAHRVDGLEGDHLGGLEGERRELGLEVNEIVVLEDHLGRARVTDACRIQSGQSGQSETMDSPSIMDAWLDESEM